MVSPLLAGRLLRRRQLAPAPAATLRLLLLPRRAAHGCAAHTWSTARVRSEFLAFFEARGHAHLPSASLVPSTDPTLLFTNAGMVQFKDWFADTELASARRVVTVQRCMRAGGKHNDLDNVGQTARHHTLFEMLGNFSFSDADDAAALAAAASKGEPSPLKAEAISHAWTFLTEVLRLPPEKLMVTVHEDDAEAEHIWRDIIGLPAEQVVHGGEDNWWSMGAGAGPVGPCTEIFWDQEQEVDGERWLELWNLVFMEQLRDADGSLSPLPRPCVDTGMGLERVVSVLQSVPSNYHTDGFDRIFAALEELTGLDGSNWRGGREEQAVAARVIADHLRAVCFLLCDGVVPSNVGRGYTFRRVLRRAVRHGTALGLHKPFLSEIMPILAERSEEWPHIAQRLGQIVPLVRQEEELFLRTMSRGLELLGAELAQVEKDAASTFNPLDPGGTLQLSAATTFQLYDTYGFPFDLTATIASERGFEVDLAGAARLMEQQRARARASGGVGEATKDSATVAVPAAVSTAWQRDGIAVSFIGHDVLAEKNVKVVAVAMDKNSDGAWIALERCPFYPTSGGQLGDVGFLGQTLGTCGAETEAAANIGRRQCEVVATIRPYEDAIACRVIPVGDEDTLWLPTVGEYVDAAVSVDHRRGCSAHHTATHMLAAALRAVLPAENVLVQAGSEVSPRRLRYDCSGVGSSGISAEALERVTELVNGAIRTGLTVSTQEMSVDEAVANGAVADFGEKYGDTVRVVTIGHGGADFVASETKDAGRREEEAAVETETEAQRFNELLLAGELCGGTHVTNTLELNAFTIIKEGGVGAGTRRVEALTAGAAYDWHEARSKMLGELAYSLKVPVQDVPMKVAKLAAEHKEMRKQVAKAKRGGKAAANATGPAGGQGVAAAVAAVSVGTETQRLVLHSSGEETMDCLRDFAAEASKADSTATHLVIGGGHIVASAGKDGGIAAGDALRACVAAVGGKGGGSPAFAQGVITAQGDQFAAACGWAEQFVEPES